jgi:hypothetical protein
MTPDIKSNFSLDIAGRPHGSLKHLQACSIHQEGASEPPRTEVIRSFGNSHMDHGHGPWLIVTSATSSGSRIPETPTASTGKLLRPESFQLPSQFLLALRACGIPGKQLMCFRARLRVSVLRFWRSENSRQLTSHSPKRLTLLSRLLEVI